MSVKPYQLVNRQRYELAADTTMISRLSQDEVISEEPLNIVLHWCCQKTGERLEKPLMVTMRTPGNDAFLVTGLLLSYAIIETAEQIESITVSEKNQCDIALINAVSFEWKKFTRHFISHSGCGICGSNNIKALAHAFNVLIDEHKAWLPLTTLLSLPAQLKQRQPIFAKTGGVHGAGIFTLQGCLSVQEDVGRHNAVDKAIGEVLTTGSLTKQSVLMLSGRVSFELMQKAIAAKIPVVVAIGSPSSLAIAAAKQFNITLIGFVSENHCNVYHGDFRIVKVGANER
ncbi:formate dehydrogenase accessory sulfurtransferase FdhD [Psychromonas sp. MME2]|uniref:formate dehydrogenase accessory sulfurtransferase FdhD n=1 Tax=unclassified Psychromonas TaxID=2614957 RepID=UPI00339BE0C9